MIVRNQHADIATCISQVHHSAMTGELGRLWNEAFIPLPNAQADVILAAALHDIGWKDWEQNPPINPETGHPYDFLEMPKHNHLEIWNNGLESSIPFGRLVGLLVFRHNTYLAAQQSINDLSQEKKDAYTQFLNDADARKRDVLNSLRLKGGKHPSDSELKEMNTFILFWDYLSLRMCMGSERNPFGPPPAIQNISFELVNSKDDDVFILNPWPFTTREIKWHCEVQYHKKGSPYKPLSIQKKLIPLILKPKL